MDTINKYKHHIFGIKALKIDDVELTATSAELNKLDGVESSTAELDQYVLSAMIADVSGAGSAWTVAPYAGTIEKMYSVITGDPGAAVGITLEIGGTAVTGGGLSIANGASAGEVDSATPTALKTVTAGQAIEIVNDGVAINAVIAEFVLVMQRS